MFIPDVICVSSVNLKDKNLIFIITESYTLVYTKTMDGIVGAL